MSDTPTFSPHPFANQMLVNLHRQFMEFKVKNRNNETALDDMALFVESAASFLGSCPGDLFKVVVPDDCPSETFKALVKWIQPLTGQKMPAARKGVLKTMAELKEPYTFSMMTHITPDELWEFTDQDSVSWVLPRFDPTADGKNAERWFFYSGALVHLNRALKFSLIDTSVGA